MAPSPAAQLASPTTLKLLRPLLPSISVMVPLSVSPLQAVRASRVRAEKAPSVIAFMLFTPLVFEIDPGADYCTPSQPRPVAEASQLPLQCLWVIQRPPGARGW